MKNKWLIILFIFFLGVILLSLLIAQQSQKAVAVAEKEIAIIEQRENRIRPVYLPGQARPAATAVKPLTSRSGITIIKAPVITAEEKSSNLPRVADKSANHIASQASQNIASTAEVAQDSLQTGITKTGKQPTPEKAREMNSSGIVLY